MSEQFHIPGQPGDAELEIPATVHAGAQWASEAESRAEFHRLTRDWDEEFRKLVEFQSGRDPRD